MIYLQEVHFDRGEVLMRRRYQSSITVFLCLMFLVFLLIITALFDFSRIIISRTQVQRSMNSTLLSVLANYSERLKSEYGLLYIDMDDLAIKNDVFNLLDSNLTRVIDYDDVLNLYNYRINRNTMSVNDNNPLALREAELLTTQILEYSKYLVPLDLAINNYSGQLNFRHLFRDVGEFQELADGFFYSLNVVEFLDKQIVMDRSVNAMLYHYFEFMNNIDGDVFRTVRPNPEASYINRPLRDAVYSESWVSATVLEEYLYDSFYASVDPVDIIATLDLYIQRLRDIRYLIVENHDHFDELFHNSNLISDAQDSIDNFEIYLDDYWRANSENSGLEERGITTVVQYKINYYNYAMNSISAIPGPEYDSLRSQLDDNYDVITQLLDQLELVRNAITDGNEPLALTLANGYDLIFEDYIEIVVSTSLRNPIRDLYTQNFPGLRDFANRQADQEIIPSRLQELVDDETMHRFFGENMLHFFDNNPSNPPRSIYNPLSKDSFDDVFLDFRYDPGKNWVNDWADAMVAPNANDWITDLIDICRDHNTPAAELAIEIFNIANFAYNIMHATNDYINDPIRSADRATDDSLEQFLINYYAMKTFRSFFTSSTEDLARLISPTYIPIMNENRRRNNLEGIELHDMPHRALRYELEYIIFGAEDFNNSNPAGENESAKYVGLLLYGNRVAKNYAFMRTSSTSREAVNMIASEISSSVPGLDNRFTEVLEAVTLFWAACESAVEITALKLGGEIFLNKPYLDFTVFLAFGRFAEQGFVYTKNSIVREVLSSTLTQPLHGTETIPFLPGVPAYRRAVMFNYDAHLMMLLTRVPNSEKISRIQEVINHNMSATPTNLDYLYNTHAGVDVRVDVTLGMTFLNWDMFRASGIGAAFDGGFTHEVTWFQMY